MFSSGGLHTRCLFVQAEDGIRYLVRSRGLGDGYKRQLLQTTPTRWALALGAVRHGSVGASGREQLGAHVFRIDARNALRTTIAGTTGTATPLVGANLGALGYCLSLIHI